MQGVMPRIIDYALCKYKDRMVTIIMCLIPWKYPRGSETGHFSEI
jgi:hypothetical protein